MADGEDDEDGKYDDDGEMMNIGWDVLYFIGQINVMNLLLVFIVR